MELFISDGILVPQEIWEIWRIPRSLQWMDTLPARFHVPSRCEWMIFARDFELPMSSRGSSEAESNLGFPSHFYLYRSPRYKKAWNPESWNTESRNLESRNTGLCNKNNSGPIWLKLLRQNLTVFWFRECEYFSDPFDPRERGSSSGGISLSLSFFEANALTAFFRTKSECNHRTWNSVSLKYAIDVAGDLSQEWRITPSHVFYINYAGRAGSQKNWNSKNWGKWFSKHKLSLHCISNFKNSIFIFSCNPAPGCLCIVRKIFTSSW